MLQKRNREFADAEIPVGLAGPFDVQIAAKIEHGFDFAAHQLVDNCAVGALGLIEIPPSAVEATAPVATPARLHIRPQRSRSIRSCPDRLRPDPRPAPDSENRSRNERRPRPRTRRYSSRSPARGTA